MEDLLTGKEHCLGSYTYIEVQRILRSEDLDEAQMLVFGGALDRIKSFGIENVGAVEITLQEKNDGGSRINYGMKFRKNNAPNVEETLKKYFDSRGDK